MDRTTTPSKHAKETSGILFVISAPSGAGKTSICTEVFKRMDNIAPSISYTTRVPRGKERDGVDYHFITAQKFNEMITENHFLEWAEVVGNFYGTSLDDIKREMSDHRDIILDIDVQGAQQIRERIKNVVTIFILPPSWEALKKRLFTRKTEDPDVIAKRLLTAEREVRNADQYDYLVVNSELEKAIDEVVAIIRAERLRTFRRKKLIAELTNTNIAL